MLTANQLQTLKTDLFATRANQIYAGKSFASHISESNYTENDIKEATQIN